MTPDPELRAADVDRDRTIALIREAYTEGRLTSDEFETRMASAQQSRTYGELAALVQDLPVQPPAPPAAVAPVPPAPTSDVAEHDEDNMRQGWAAWAGVGVLMVVIWGASWMTEGGSPPYFWPIWVIGPWGAAMLIGTLSKRSKRRR